MGNRFVKVYSHNPNLKSGPSSNYSPSSSPDFSSDFNLNSSFCQDYNPNIRPSPNSSKKSISYIDANNL